MRTPSERGRASRDKGVRFERKLARLFKAEGFIARRVLEYDRGAGVDLEIGVVWRPFTKDHPQVSYWAPYAIQVKATNRESDLQVGLQEAQTGRPAAKVWVCIHRFRRKLRILYLEENAPVPEEVTWRVLIERLKAGLPGK